MIGIRSGTTVGKGFGKVCGSDSAADDIAVDCPKALRLHQKQLSSSIHKIARKIWQRALWILVQAEEMPYAAWSGAETEYLAVSNRSTLQMRKGFSL